MPDDARVAVLHALAMTVDSRQPELDAALELVVSSSMSAKTVVDVVDSRLELVEVAEAAIDVP